jgi:peptidoglycan/xylan/chitin deacetylase (PgdA/CDA1 family)
MVGRPPSARTGDLPRLLGAQTGPLVSRLRRLASKLRQAIKWRASDAIFAAGLGKRLHRDRPGGRIIVYHGVDAVGSLEHNTRFISSGTLERHLRHFRDHLEVVTLADFFAGRRASDRLTIAVTFDDGYSNNLERALPVIENVGVPVTIFVTGCAETDGEILWPDLLDLATPAVRRRVVIGGEDWLRGRRGELVSETTGESLKLRCKRSSWEFINEMMTVLRPFFESRDPDRFGDYWRHLNHREIRRLAESELIAIGSHGAHHTCLGAIDHESACDELRRSKAYLEDSIDAEVTALAYPDGSYTRELVASAAEIGFDRQFAVDFLHPEDAGDGRLRERLGANPFISWNNQLWAILVGRY